MQSKVCFFNKSNETVDAVTVNNFGFKSVLAPPKIEHLNAFEQDLYELVRQIEFKRFNTAFQNQLNKDTNMINKNPLIYICR